MWSLLAANSASLNAIINFLMLIVWALYFQLLLNSHRRQKRAKILINRSAGHDFDANCLISNMSAEPIYLQAVVVTLDPDGAAKRYSLTDLNTLSKQPESDPRAFWFQGPLMTGEYINLGSFRNVLSEIGVAPDRQDGDAGERQRCPFDLLIIATYGPDDQPVAAERSFVFDPSEEDPGKLRAKETRQIRSLRERRALRRYLREE